MTELSTLLWCRFPREWTAVHLDFRNPGGVPRSVSCITLTLTMGMTFESSLDGSVIWTRRRELIPRVSFPSLSPLLSFHQRKLKWPPLTRRYPRRLESTKLNKYGVITLLLSMDVVQYVADRQPELEALAELLHFCPPAQRPPVYRRPASGNIPVSRVIHTTKQKSKRARSRTASLRDPLDAFDAEKQFTAAPLAYAHVIALEVGPLTQSSSTGRRSIASSATAALVDEKEHLTRLALKRNHRRSLPYTAWRALQKRKRRMLVGKRPVAQRRRVTRQLALRYGRQPPACACSAGPLNSSSSSTPPLLTDRKVSWLPSHERMTKRFRMRPQRRTLSDDLVHRPYHGGSTATSTTGASKAHAAATTVYVAAPVRAYRKRHRCLQRWVGSLAALRGSRQLRFSGTAPPVSLLTDRSHECIYRVYCSEVRADATTEEAAEQFQEWLGLVQVESSRGYLASAAAEQGGPPPEIASVQVTHGHMRAASRQAPHIVPVALITQPQHTGLGDRASPAVREALLVTAAPVSFTARAITACHIQLISSWSTCTAAPTPAASVFEWWCAVGEAVGSTAGDIPIVAAATVSAFHRVIRSGECRNASSSDGPPTSRKQGDSGGSARACVRSVIVFPSLSPSPMVALPHAHRISHCVWSVLLLHTPRPAATLTSHRASNSAVRRKHFACARLLFGTLVSAGCKIARQVPDRDAVERGTEEGGLRQPHAVVPRGYRRGVKTVGLEDRRTLLHLLGKPCFPHDYGYVRRGAARVGTADSLERASVSARFAVTARAYGNLTNASERVVVRAYHSTHRLPRRFAAPGTILLRVMQLPNGALDVARVGVVTSSPLFWHRLGCEAVQVWCCFPPPAGGLSWTKALAPTVAVETPPQQVALFVLAAAEDHLSTTAFSSPTKRQRKAEPPVSMGRGSQREHWLCDEERCLPVEPLTLYV